MPRFRRRSPVETEEIAALLASCRADDGPGGARDAAILALVCGLGLQPTELRSLDLDDYQQDAHLLRVRNSRKEHAIFLSENIHSALAQWISVRGLFQGPLFLPIRRGQLILTRRLPPNVIREVLERRATQAGITPLTLDDIKRTQRLLHCGQWSDRCCSPLLDRGELLPIPCNRRCTESLALLTDEGEDDSLDLAIEKSTRFTTPVSLNIVGRYLARLKPSQQLATREILAQLSSRLGGSGNVLSFPWTDVDFKNGLIQSDIANAFSHQALLRAKKALNGVLKEAWLLNQVSTDTYRAVCRAQWSTPAKRQKQCTRIRWPEVQLLLDACQRDQSAAGRRDAALIALLWREQIGMAEAISYPYEREASAKFSHQHCTSGSDPVCRALKEWSMIRGINSGPFLYSISRHGSILSKPMTPSAVAFALKRRSWDARLPKVATTMDIRIGSIQFYSELQDRCFRSEG